MQTVGNLLLNGNTPVTVGGTGTTAKFFPPQPGPSITNVSTKVGYIFCPGQNKANNQLLHVIAAGNAAPDPTIACPTFKVELVATLNPFAASPTYVAICSPTAVAFGDISGEAMATQPWSIEAWLQGDGVGGTVQGTWSNGVGGDFDNVDSELSNVLINVNMGIDPPFALAVRVTFGTTGAGNTASMYQFAIEQ